MIALYTLAAPIVLWALFLMYCALAASMRNGKFQRAPLVVRAASWVLLIIMGSFDILFNVTIGSLLFLEPPSIHRPTFTERCSALMNEESWRGAIARWICTGWLNPFDDNHCKA